MSPDVRPQMFGFTPTAARRAAERRHLHLPLQQVSRCETASTTGVPLGGSAEQVEPNPLMESNRHTRRNVSQNVGISFTRPSGKEPMKELLDRGGPFQNKTGKVRLPVGARGDT